MRRTLSTSAVTVVIRVRVSAKAGLRVTLKDVASPETVELDAIGLDAARVENALFAAGAAAAVDGDQVLISVEWLRSQARWLAEDPSWAAAFESMLTEARQQERYYSQVEAIRIPGLRS